MIPEKINILKRLQSNPQGMPNFDLINAFMDPSREPNRPFIFQLVNELVTGGFIESDKPYTFSDHSITLGISAAGREAINDFDRQEAEKQQSRIQEIEQKRQWKIGLAISSTLSFIAIIISIIALITSMNS